VLDIAMKVARQILDLLAADTEGVGGDQDAPGSCAALAGR
jgi:hypothetical protein